LWYNIHKGDGVLIKLKKPEELSGYSMVCANILWEHNPNGVVFLRHDSEDWYYEDKEIILYLPTLEEFVVEKLSQKDYPEYFV